MTNEDKAREIAETEVHPIIAERCALKMAEWKDHQFKEYLEEKAEVYESMMNNATRPIDRGIYYERRLMIVAIINELFNEE